MSTHFEIEYCHQGHPMIFYEALERDATCFVCRVEISDEAYASFSQVDHFIYKCQGCAAVNVGFAYVRSTDVVSVDIHFMKVVLDFRGRCKSIFIRYTSFALFSIPHNVVSSANIHLTMK
ncbi:hypothetical protein V6N13_054568 [Hibiscus sabdariffa]